MLKINPAALLPLLLVFLLTACGDDKKGNGNTVDPPKPDTAPPPKPIAPALNADSIYAYVEKQMAFGDRIPNSKAHVACGDWFESFLKTYADTVYVQAFTAVTHDRKKLNARNFIASFNPGSATRILVSAHWDTRPLADQDPEKPNAPVPGANDGASGVGVILEMARVMKANPPKVGVDFILWDVEDLGEYNVENSFCLGSQYWVKNRHLPNYRPKFGINLDMVGAADAKFFQEGWSRKFALQYVNEVWTVANQLGYSKYFLWIAEDGGIIDDHYYLATEGGIPMVEIIHRDPSTGNFFPHWHTVEDNMEKIAKEPMLATGQTVMEVIYRQK